MDDEKNHSVSMADDGAFVVAWENKTVDDVFLQRYDNNGSALGSAIQVTTSNKQDERPSIAMSASGRFVVVWSNMFNVNTQNIFGQLYRSDGSSTSKWVDGIRIIKWIEIK